MIKNARLYMSRGYVLFEGMIPHTLDHRHHALEIFIGLEESMDVISGQQRHRGQILVLDSNVLHRVSGALDRKVILLLDPESVTARNLRERFLINSPIADLSTIIDIASLINALTEIKLSHETSSHIIYNCILAYLIDKKQPVSLPDERIRKIQGYLRDLMTKKAPLSAIAREVHLSEGRLVHLFKEQVGIPIRRYQLWLRLIDSIECVLAGHSLTDAAHQAGFSDYAHLSRTFKQMFGYSLSDIFKSNTSIEIVSGSEL